MVSTTQALLASLTTGLLTGGLAILGLVIVQRRTDERDRVAREHEQKSWAREQKRQVHSAFLIEQRRVDQWMMRVTRMGGDDVETPQEGWYHPLSALLGDVQLFGSDDTAVAAQRLYRATLQLESGTVGSMMVVDGLRGAYRHHVQLDLGLQPTRLPVWGGEDEPEWASVGAIESEESG